MSFAAAVLLPAVFVVGLALQLSLSGGVEEGSGQLTVFSASQLDAQAEAPESEEREQQAKEETASARPKQAAPVAPTQAASEVAPPVMMPRIATGSNPFSFASSDERDVSQPLDVASPDTSGKGNGAGAEGASGGEGPAQASAASGGGSASQADEYAQAVFRRIRSRQHYEDSLARAGAMGTTLVHLHIGRRGDLRKCGIVRSSGDKRIDRVALRHLRSAAPFPRPPRGQERKFEIPMTYRPKNTE